MNAEDVFQGIPRAPSVDGAWEADTDKTWQALLAAGKDPSNTAAYDSAHAELDIFGGIPKAGEEVFAGIPLATETPNLDTPPLEGFRPGKITLDRNARPPLPGELTPEEKAVAAAASPVEGRSPALAEIMTQAQRGNPKSVYGGRVPLEVAAAMRRAGIIELPHEYNAPPPVPESPDVAAGRPLAESAQAMLRREGADVLTTGRGVMKGLARGATGGMARPPVSPEEEPGAVFGATAGGMAPLALAAVPGVGETILPLMAAQSLTGTARVDENGRVQNPIETGVQMGLASVLGGLPAAAGEKLVAKITTGAGIGALQAQVTQAVTDLSEKGHLDPKDPEAIKNTVIQMLMGAGFGLAHARGPKHSLIEHVPEITNQGGENVDQNREGLPGAVEGRQAIVEAGRDPAGGQEAPLADRGIQAPGETRPREAPPVIPPALERPPALSPLGPGEDFFRDIPRARRPVPPLDPAAMDEALLQRLRRDAAPTEEPVVSSPITAEKVEGDKINSRWRAFSEASGTLGIPRGQMPQVAAEHRGALANFLAARGMEVTPEDALPGSLRPSQAEYAPGKVAKAGSIRESGDQNIRRILVSSDGHVIDGHHQWMDRLANEPGSTIPVLKIAAPAKDILSVIHEFPSAGMEKPVDLPEPPPTPPKNGGPKPFPESSRPLAATLERRISETPAQGLGDFSHAGERYLSLGDQAFNALLDKNTQGGKRLVVSDEDAQKLGIKRVIPGGEPVYISPKEMMSRFGVMVTIPDKEVYNKGLGIWEKRRPPLGAEKPKSLTVLAHQFSEEHTRGIGEALGENSTRHYTDADFDPEYGFNADDVAGALVNRSRDAKTRRAELLRAIQERNPALQEESRRAEIEAQARELISAGAIAKSKEGRYFAKTAEGRDFLGMVAESEHPYLASLRDIVDHAARAKRGEVTESPHFRRWFGDSMVVDAEGKPMVVYHGTRSDFEEFKASDSQAGLGAGFYFTDRPEVAGGYAGAAHKSPRVDRFNEGAATLPVYLSIKRPASIDDFRKAYREIADQKIYGESPTSIEIQRQLRAKGFDGIHEIPAGGGNIYVAFDAAQIKSATGNRGTFDPGDPSIVHEAPGAGSVAEKQRFEDPNQGDLFNWRDNASSTPEEHRATREGLDEADRLLEKEGAPSEENRNRDHGQGGVPGSGHDGGGPGGLPGKLAQPRVVASLLEKLKKQGWVDLRGTVVKSSQDIASAARVWRNKHFETFRLIYIKDGKILAHEGVTSRIPSFSRLFAREGDKRIKELSDILRRSRRLDVDEVVMMHNHPSGNPTPSLDDLTATQVLAHSLAAVARREGLPARFENLIRRHIVIDHDTYHEIPVKKGLAGKGEPGKIIDPGEDVLTASASDHAALSASFKTLPEIVSYTAHLVNDPRTVDVIFSDPHGGARLITSFPSQFFTTPAALNVTQAKIRRLARDYGASMAFAYYRNPESHAAMKALIRQGVIMDAVHQPEAGAAYSVRWKTGLLDRFPGLFPEVNVKGFKVGESQEASDERFLRQGREEAAGDRSLPEPRPGDLLRKYEPGPVDGGRMPRPEETLGKAVTYDPIRGEQHSGWLTPAERLYTAGKNEAYPIEKIQTILERLQGKPLPKDQNIRYAINQVLGSGGSADLHLHQRLMPIFQGGKLDGVEYPKLIPQEIRLVDAYALARDAIWRYDNTDYENPTLSREHALRILTAYKGLPPALRDKVERAADGMVNYAKDLSLRKVAAGHWTKEEFEKFTRNPYYVPEIRDFQAVTNKPIGKAKKDAFASTNKLFRGTFAVDVDAPVFDPITALVHDTHEFASETAKRVVSNSIVDMMEAHPELKKLIKRQHPDHVPGTAEGELKTLRPRVTALSKELQDFADKYKRAKFTLEQSSNEERQARDEGILRVHTEKVRDQIARLPKDKQSLLGPDMQTILGRVEANRKAWHMKSQANAEKVVEAFKKLPAVDRLAVEDFINEGKPTVYVVPKEIADAVQGMGVLELGTVGKFMSAAAGVFRASTTSYNPFFAAMNLIRDTHEAYVNTGSTPWHALKGLYHYYTQDEVYQKFMKHGGSMASDKSNFVRAADAGKDIRYGDRFFRDRYKRVMDSEAWREKKLGLLGREIKIGQLARMAEAIKKTVGIPFEMSAAFGEASEMMTRLGIMDYALTAKKLSPPEGVALARRGTLDFKRLGSKAKKWNALIPFLNASLEATDMAVKIAVGAVTGNRASQLAALRLGASVIPAAIALLAWNQKNKHYAEVPAWKKNFYWIIMKAPDSKDYFMIPKSGIAKLVVNPAQMVFENMLGTTNQSAWQVGANLASNLGPIDNAGSTLPHALGLGVEELTNKNFYFDRPVVEHPELPAPQQWDKTTFESMKTIGRALNWSPERLQHIFLGVTGGTGMNLLWATDKTLAAGGLQPNHKFEVSQTPLVNRFYGEAQDWQSDLAAKRRELLQEIKPLRESIGLQMRGGGMTFNAWKSVYPKRLQTLLEGARTPADSAEARASISKEEADAMRILNTKMARLQEIEDAIRAAQGLKQSIRNSGVLQE